jgi:hypothetical protein
LSGVLGRPTLCAEEHALIEQTFETTKPSRLVLPTLVATHGAVGVTRSPKR